MADNDNNSFFFNIYIYYIQLEMNCSVVSILHIKIKKHQLPVYLENKISKSKISKDPLSPNAKLIDYTTQKRDLQAAIEILKPSEEEEEENGWVEIFRKLKPSWRIRRERWDLI